MKVGRNDPCPCGSEKKYKHCCLKPVLSNVEGPVLSSGVEGAGADDLLWHRLRRVLDGLPVRLLKFSDECLGRQGIEEAWGDFYLGEDQPFDPGSPYIPVFMPWFFFDWTPDPVGSAIPPSALGGLTLAGAYLRKKGRNLDPLLVRYLESCIRAPFSFHEVVECTPGSGFALRDILTGEQQDVTERSGSAHAQPGDILFAKAAAVDHVCMLEGCTPVLIPPIEKRPILELRKRLGESGRPLTTDLLKDYDFEMIDVYLDIADRLLNPQMPVLQNTDGDPLLFHKLLYDIESPREAFDALKCLCLTEDEKGLLAQAEFDPAGELRKLKITWQKRDNAKHKEWTNTVLGRIVIEDRTLTAQVNSKKRAKQFQSLIAERLPGKARYKTTVLESPEAMLADARQGRDSEEARTWRAEQEALNALPEVREQTTRMLREHYERWVREKIPLLGGKTPLQAMKTPDGREMVEALVLQIERDSQKTKPPLDPSIIQELRVRLGLAKQDEPPL